MTPGDKVRCVNAYGQAFLREGAEYTVGSAYGKYITVAEYPARLPAAGWYKSRFKVISSTDISVFQDILNAVRAKVPA